MRGITTWATEVRADDRGAAGEPDDEQLLDRVLGDDEAASHEAFRALVSRHGPMVLGVCRQILGGVHDAEDAFQATFLVLARRAGAIRNGRALGAWLHEVAYRTAVRAKADAARRRSLEKEAADMSAGRHQPERPWSDLGPVLHEEINRLPETYRSAVVLCYMEGLTTEEAANRLRWPVGTVKGRLSRARDILRSRLTRRGLALSAAFLMARLAHHRAFAEAVPPALAEATARGAVAVARGGPDPSAVLSPRILELIEDELSGRTGPPGFAPFPGFLGLLLAAALFFIMAAASGQGPEAAYRVVVNYFAATPGVAGGCHHAR